MALVEETWRGSSVDKALLNYFTFELGSIHSLGSHREGHDLRRCYLTSLLLSGSISTASWDTFLLFYTQFSKNLKFVFLFQFSINNQTKGLMFFSHNHGTAALAVSTKWMDIPSASQHSTHKVAQWPSADGKGSLADCLWYTILK